MFTDFFNQVKRRKIMWKGEQRASNKTKSLLSFTFFKKTSIYLKEDKSKGAVSEIEHKTSLIKNITLSLRAI